MGNIRVLPDTLVNQIAAGEVIERPASVVKELLENALDAGATHVTVEISKGGTEKITVTDNGNGMDEMDARLAFERHATSKIGSLDDLNRIRTLGFRGEALASIASVSAVVLQTKTAQSLGGIRLEMSGGKAPVVTSAGCPQGTKLEVLTLFFNTPARKKYLKSEATEYRHVLDTVQDLALAHPEVGFRLVSNGRTVFDLAKTEQLRARVGALLGKSVSDELSEVFYGGRDIQISGWVGKPHTARATRTYQYFVVNGRVIRDNRLGYAVKEAFSTLIPGSRYPIFVLNVMVDPSQVDVNVHPRKLEVRFAQPNEVFRVVKSSVAAALAREHHSGMTPTVPLRDKNFEMPAFLRKETIRPAERPHVAFDESGSEYDPTMATVANFFGSAENAPAPVSSVFTTESSRGGEDAVSARKAYLLQKRAERMAAQGRYVGEEGEAANVMAGGRASQGLPGQTFASSGTAGGDASGAAFGGPATPVGSFTQSYMEDRLAGSLTPLAQIKNSYLVAEDDDGIVIIDQHAAHERVMLGKLRAAEAERTPARQPLLAPLQLELDYRESAVLAEHLELLGSLGFDIAEFGGNTYCVEAVPDFLADDDAVQVIRGFLDDLLNEQAPREAARRHDHLLHTLACRAAAKFGRRLSSYEQQALLRELLSTEGSNACAHGRPTMIRLTFSELEQKFGRKG